MQCLLNCGLHPNTNDLTSDMILTCSPHYIPFHMCYTKTCLRPLKNILKNRDCANQRQNSEYYNFFWITLNAFWFWLWLNNLIKNNLLKVQLHLIFCLKFMAFSMCSSRKKLQNIIALFDLLIMSWNSDHD